MSAVPVRFALVGCGGIARHHLQALRSCAEATRVVAVVDTKPENATQLAGLIPKEQSAGHCQVGGACLFISSMLLVLLCFSGWLSMTFGNRVSC